MSYSRIKANMKFIIGFVTSTSPFIGMCYVFIYELIYFFSSRIIHCWRAKICVMKKQSTKTKRSIVPTLITTNLWNTWASLQGMWHHRSSNHTHHYHLAGSILFHIVSFFERWEQQQEKPLCFLRTKVGILCIFFYGTSLSLNFKITILYKMPFRFWEDIKPPSDFNFIDITDSMLGNILSLHYVSDLVLAVVSLELCICNLVLQRIRNMGIFMINH